MQKELIRSVRRKQEEPALDRELYKKRIEIAVLEKAAEITKRKGHQSGKAGE